MRKRAELGFWKPVMRLPAELDALGVRWTTVRVGVGRLGDGVGTRGDTELERRLEDDSGLTRADGVATALGEAWRGCPGDRTRVSGCGAAGGLGVDVTGAGGERGFGMEVMGLGADVTGCGALRPT